MTSNNIKKLQILAITDDEEDKYLMATTDEKILINAIVKFCQFAKLKNVCYLGFVIIYMSMNFNMH
jgi:hypothetical protein